jgi:acyl carrier protein
VRCGALFSAAVLPLLGCRAPKLPLPPHERDALAETVHRIAADQLRLDVRDVPLDEPLSRPPMNAHPYDLLQMLARFQDELGFEVRAEDTELARRLRSLTVLDLAALVRRRLASKRRD